MATVSVAGREAPMGTKDRGGRNTKKVAGKSLKEKRLAKKTKRADHAARSNRSVEQTFGR